MVIAVLARVIAFPIIIGAYLLAAAAVIAIIVFAPFVLVVVAFIMLLIWIDKIVDSVTRRA